MSGAYESLEDGEELLDLDKAAYHAKRASQIGAASVFVLLIAVIVPGWGGFGSVTYKVLLYFSCAKSYETGLFSDSCYDCCEWEEST